MHGLGIAVRCCAWHKKFHGYPMLYGFSRAWRFQVTHGLCRWCAALVRKEIREKYGSPIGGQT